MWICTHIGHTQFVVRCRSSRIVPHLSFSTLHTHETISSSNVMISLWSFLIVNLRPNNNTAHANDYRIRIRLTSRENCIEYCCRQVLANWVCLHCDAEHLSVCIAKVSLSIFNEPNIRNFPNKGEYDVHTRTCSNLISLDTHTPTLAQALTRSDDWLKAVLPSGRRNAIRRENGLTL